ncbi:exported protein of unknown function [Streptomyces murinus]
MRMSTCVASSSVRMTASVPVPPNGAHSHHCPPRRTLHPEGAPVTGEKRLPTPPRLTRS